jgi:GH15 family glucan-1,4-alpha-glucosidase
MRLEEPEPHVLRDYALIADGERGILVGPDGDFAWMCFPRWDSDGIFSSLIGGDGAYQITPNARYTWGGYYEEGSLIWHSRWILEGGAVVESREALALPSSAGRAVILRRVTALHGTARVGVVLKPRAGFGAHSLRRLARTEAGHWIGRSGGIHLCWSGAERARPGSDGRHGKALSLELELPEGAHHDFVLVMSIDPDAAKQLPDPETAWSATEAQWRERVPKLGEAVAQRDARHAHAVLTGLTSGGGGMVAATTMSLPERAREGRNYDYRYVWIRDQCYAASAVAKAGFHPLLDDAVRFVRERLLDDGPQLKPAYTVTGGDVPGERALDLPGYPGGSDVLGNHAGAQFQLDAFGEALLLFSVAAKHDRMDAETWRAAQVSAAAIKTRWTEKDAGIWELDPDEWTHSRLICVAGLRAISDHVPGRESARWLALADAIVAQTSARSLHPSGRWQRSPTDARVDAALLLPAIRGGIPANDPRTIATLHAVEHELTREGYVYRFRADERPLGEAEGAFLLCGFLLALAQAQQGDSTAAARSFERNRGACGPPGLFSEEFDVSQRQLRGNLPQAFVHALLLETAIEQGRRS